MPEHEKSNQDIKEIGTYSIYQLNDSPELRYHRFTSLDSLEKDKLSIDKANYNLVYTETLKSTDTLDSIYTKFNTDHPNDFFGHSLSISDIISVSKDGKDTTYYVDTFGFKEIPNFHEKPSIRQLLDDIKHNEPKPIAKSKTKSNDLEV